MTQRVSLVKWWLRRNLNRKVWFLLHFGDVASRNQVGAAGTDFNQENYQ